MGRAAPTTRMTADEYLAFEARSAVKHEYVGGAIFAMAGGTKDHHDVTFTLTALLRAALRGPCRAYMAEVKVRVEAADAFFYPDVHVTCDPTDHADRLISRSPSVIIEVLSDSTAEYDRGDKFATYRRLESLQEYVLVDSRVQRVEVFRRHGQVWHFLPLTASDRLTLTSVDVDLEVSRIYEDTAVPAHRPPRDSAP